MLNSNYLYDRLHKEIIFFKDSVKDILNEIQPIKEYLIAKISDIIKKAIPGSEVRVYGSHATKLCLPWSDIDIAIITTNCDPPNIYNNNFALTTISNELKSHAHQSWIKESKHVE